MSSPALLESLLEQWEDLTSAESDAISGEQWDALAEVHRRKADLKTALLSIPPALPARLSPLIARLVEMERRNLAELRARIGELKVQLAGLQNSSRNLRRIQRSYTGGWQPVGAFCSIA